MESCYPTTYALAHTASLRVTGLLRGLKADILQPWEEGILRRRPKAMRSLRPLRPREDLDAVWPIGIF